MEIFILLSNHLDKFYTLFLLIFISLTIRFVLNFIGQKWITTLSHTATIILLPIITYVITNVISGNIALSLGMVGALSIVRFRNPVRSPLELAIYFAAITMGIAASVNLLWLIFLGLSMGLVTFVLILIEKLSLYFQKKSFFNISFSEGNTNSTLELKLNNELDFLNKNNFLLSKEYDGKNFNYVLISKNFTDLEKILNKLEKSEHLVNYQFNK
tara:strand:+ start:191 stop:832 length:642 start_codon:yes stop_codon:yes gene_type:complete